MQYQWMASFNLRHQELAAYSKKSTISSREIQTAVRLILPGELSKHAISEGTKSVTKVCILVYHAILNLFIATVFECRSEVDLPISIVLFSFVFLLYCRRAPVLTDEVDLSTLLFCGIIVLR
jgi:hypothetical protein